MCECGCASCCCFECQGHVSPPLRSAGRTDEPWTGRQLRRQRYCGQCCRMMVRATSVWPAGKGTNQIRWSTYSGVSITTTGPVAYRAWQFSFALIRNQYPFGGLIYELNFFRVAFTRFVFLFYCWFLIFYWNELIGLDRVSIKAHEFLNSSIWLSCDRVKRSVLPRAHIDCVCRQGCQIKKTLSNWWINFRLLKGLNWVSQNFLEIKLEQAAV